MSKKQHSTPGPWCWSSFDGGKTVFLGLRSFLNAVKHGKPIRQSIVRRMTVKGKTVHTIERFTAPVGKGRSR